MHQHARSPGSISSNAVRRACSRLSADDGATESIRCVAACPARRARLRRNRCAHVSLLKFSRQIPATAGPDISAARTRRAHTRAVEAHMTKTMIKTMSVTVGTVLAAAFLLPATGSATPATSPIATPWSRSTSVISPAARPERRRRALEAQRNASAPANGEAVGALQGRATPAASRPSRRPSRTPRSPCRRAAKGQPTNSGG